MVAVGEDAKIPVQAARICVGCHAYALMGQDGQGSQNGVVQQAICFAPGLPALLRHRCAASAASTAAAPAQSWRTPGGPRRE